MTILYHTVHSTPILGRQDYTRHHLARWRHVSPVPVRRRCTRTKEPPGGWSCLTFSGDPTSETTEGANKKKNRRAYGGVSFDFFWLLRLLATDTPSHRDESSSSSRTHSEHSYGVRRRTTKSPRCMTGSHAYREEAHLNSVFVFILRRARIRSRVCRTVLISTNHGSRPW